MADGQLRQIFAKRFPRAMWTPVESFSTGRGIPDVEYCFPGGASGWVENKLTKGWTVGMRPEQVAWLERRARLGGRSFVAVRQVLPAGPRRGEATDDLWLYPGQDARCLLLDGLEKPPLGRWQGGPGGWDWQAIEALLTGR